MNDRMDDCRTLRLRYGNQSALSAVRRWGQYLSHTAPATGTLPQAMQYGYVNMAIVAVTFLFTLMFQPVSMRLRTLLPECWLRRMFSGILLMIATLILVTL
ncbi:hypothetical protein [Superficieibacter electus]|uniref:hypothetical protein n=1 Tax=Superficieibacter electus TaxID=2022662 RepID=UPI001FE4E6F6|nr:hypothetical protein [Superficieibacter electus]